MARTRLFLAALAAASAVAGCRNNCTDRRSSRDVCDTPNRLAGNAPVVYDGATYAAAPELTVGTPVAFSVPVAPYVPYVPAPAAGPANELPPPNEYIPPTRVPVGGASQSVTGLR